MTLTGRLVVISVTMFWGVALKLVRYKKEDPTDIVAMLRHSTKLDGVQWTPHIMETWIKTLCWPMGYNTYKPQQAQELRNRIHDAVHHLQKLSDTLPEESSHMALTQSAAQSPPVASTTRSPAALSSLHTMSSSLAPHSFSQPASHTVNQVLHIQLFFDLSFGTLQCSSLTEPPSASTPSVPPGISHCPTPSPSPILAPDSTTQPVASHNMSVGMGAGTGMVGTGMGGGSELMGFYMLCILGITLANVIIRAALPSAYGNMLDTL
ncbi:hypothetical protein C8R48DRAFT_195776 [Suillus tomentosus]|nr:hypothetical protein C8R48DRAFT_195776 [Suillus tomentosus]